MTRDAARPRSALAITLFRQIARHAGRRVLVKVASDSDAALSLQAARLLGFGVEAERIAPESALFACSRRVPAPTRELEAEP